MVQWPTLLEEFDKVQEPVRPVEKPLRLPLQVVYKIWALGQSLLAVLTGVLKPGTMIRFAPCRVESLCKSVETHNEALSEAKAVTTSGSTS